MGAADITLSQAITQQLNQQEQSIANLEEQVSWSVAQQAVRQPCRRYAGTAAVLTGQPAVQLAGQRPTATSWLGMGNDALNSVLDDMQGARTLILQTLNQGTQNATTYQAAAQQLQGINADLLSTANTQYEGRPIFAGTSASSQAYDASGTTGEHRHPQRGHRFGARIGSDGRTLRARTIGLWRRRSQRVQYAQHRLRRVGSGAPTATQMNAALTALTPTSARRNRRAVLGNGSDQVTVVSASLPCTAHDRAEHQAGLEDVNVATVTTQLTRR